jgi:hypothetical protein
MSYQEVAWQLVFSIVPALIVAWTTYFLFSKKLESHKAELVKNVESFRAVLTKEIDTSSKPI